MTMSHPRCRVCGEATAPTHTATVLGKYEAQYYMCTACDYWFIEDPFWLAEAYTKAISALDTGAAARNLAAVRSLRLPLRCLSRNGRVVDWAGGAGLLTRLLRDCNIDAYWQDSYADNVFAQGFEWERELAPAATVLAIEALEHTVGPVSFINSCLTETSATSFVFSQLLHSGPRPDWWYLAPGSGQHISFFSRRTLQVIAGSLEWNIYSAGSYHLLTPKAFPTGLFKWMVRISTRAPDKFFSRPDKTWQDHLQMAARLGSPNA